MNPVTSTRYDAVRYLVLWSIFAAVYATVFGQLADMSAGMVAIGGAVFGAVAGFEGLILWSVLKYGAEGIKWPLLKTVYLTVVGMLFVAVAVGAETVAIYLTAEMAAGMAGSFATTIPARCLTTAAVYVCFALWYSSAARSEAEGAFDDGEDGRRGAARTGASVSRGSRSGAARREAGTTTSGGSRREAGTTTSGVSRSEAGEIEPAERETPEERPESLESPGESERPEGSERRERLESPDRPERFEKPERLERITVKGAGGRIEVIDVARVIYIKAEGDYVAIVTSEGRWLKEGTMKWFEESLPRDRFVRVHRSYIVAVGHISRIETSGRDHTLVLRGAGGPHGASGGGGGGRGGNAAGGASIRLSEAGYRLLKRTLGL